LHSKYDEKLEGLAKRYKEIIDIEEEACYWEKKKLHSFRFAGVAIFFFLLIAGLGG
jgi:hypothetical protein